MQDVRSARPYVPAEQVEQPVRVLVSCLPAAQVMHELCLEPDWYWPAAQVLQEVCVWELEDWYCPAAHCLQVTWPVVSAKRPVGHAVHVESCCGVALAIRCAPASHSVQRPGLAAPQPT